MTTLMATNLVTAGHQVIGFHPAPAADRSDAGAFSALGGQDVGVTGVGVAPAQVFLHLTGQDGVVRMVRVRHGEGA